MAQAALPLPERRREPSALSPSELWLRPLERLQGCGAAMVSPVVGARHTPRTNTIIPSYRGTYGRAWMALSEPARWGQDLPRRGSTACPGSSQRAERRVACDPLLYQSLLVQRMLAHIRVCSSPPFRWEPAHG